MFIQQIFSAKDNDNLPLSGGHLYLYRSKTEILVPMYESLGSSFVKTSNPYILDDYGFAPNLFLWDLEPGPFRLNVTDKDGNQMPDYPIDNLTRLPEKGTSISSKLDFLGIFNPNFLSILTPSYNIHR